VKRAVTQLRDEGARSLILDLRDTPGGLLDEGIALTDLFLDRDQVVVDTRGRSRASIETYRTRDEQQWPEMPIVVLVNGGSASAAEIIAGALQDHDRAVILGTPTFGKGLVQTVYPFAPDHALQITTGRWYTPNGRSIQRPIQLVGESLQIVGGREEELADRSGDTTVTESSEVYYTDAGRPVIGGGGIRPDVTVRPDTLTDEEQAFWRALGADIPAYRGAVTTYALELKAGGAITRRDFRATAAMRDELMRRLREHGIDVPNATVRGARSVLTRQLEYEVTRYVFGRDVETMRRTRDDVQVSRALELLQGAPTPEQLLARVVGESGSEGDAENR
jgi:carboxyl-terminal processing protease